MESTLKLSKEIISGNIPDFERYLTEKIHWDWRLVGIKGARGVGKTTLLLQHIRKSHGTGDEAIYVSLDNIYFTENRLVDLASQFRSHGGRYLYLDEVHKYPSWAREVKNIYDSYPDLYIVFTGSSILEIARQNVDLSRRAVMYEMHGLSFREYLGITGSGQFGPFSLDQVLKDHAEIAGEITAKLKPLPHFLDYLKWGYYPFFNEGREIYHRRLQQMVELVLESDLRFIGGFDARKTRKMYQLLYNLATNVPFKPNISKLSERTGMARNTLVQYMHYLDQTRLVALLNSPNKGISLLQKPEKIYLDNTNLAYALAPENVNPGTLRETFFRNQIASSGHVVNYSDRGDFLVDGKYIFECGGRGKSGAQVAGTGNAFVAADNIEVGFHKKIPLWLFGLLS